METFRFKDDQKNEIWLKGLFFTFLKSRYPGKLNITLFFTRKVDKVIFIEEVKPPDRKMIKLATSNAQLIILMLTCAQ